MGERFFYRLVHAQKFHGYLLYFVALLVRPALAERENWFY